MIKSFFILLLAWATVQPAISCSLPKSEVLNIGCTYGCDFFYRFRLNMTAMRMGYKIRIKTLFDINDLKSIDGVLLPGGADIDPEFYLNQVSSELQEYTRENLHLVKFTEEGKQRDSFEYALVQTYSRNDEYKNLPMLGICRGLQMMSVAQGIPLYLDIKTELGMKNRIGLFDRISTEVEGRMSEIYRGRTFKGFKLHHQGIRVPYYLENVSQYPNTKVTAWSNDHKIAEAIEYTHRPALGVQYHPERSFTGTSAPVFRWFLTKACENKVQSLKEPK